MRIVGPALALAFAAGSAIADDALPTPGSVFRDCANCPEMVVLPPGDFWMGNATAPGSTRTVDIRHRFAMGRYEVILAEYAAFVAETGHDPRESRAR